MSAAAGGKPFSLRIAFSLPISYDSDSMEAAAMYYFISNPTSRSASAMKLDSMIEQIFRREGAGFRHFETTHAGHACDLAREISENDPHAVIIPIGGDGSIHEVLNGLTHLDTVTLGLIPSGSGNDFARGMGIPTQPEKAISAILHPGRIIRMDVGRVKSGQSFRRFAVSSGIGFDAAVCHKALSSVTKDLLNRFGLGQLTYSAIAAEQIAFYRPCTLKVRVDGGQPFTCRKVHFAAVMNQKFEGGGCMMTPDARPEDGLLDVLIVGGMPRIELIAALPLARGGLHTWIPGLKFIRCRSVDFLAEKPCPIHLDGESGGIKRLFSVGLEPEKLAVIVS